jgi:hypothetical protein
MSRDPAAVLGREATPAAAGFPENWRLVVIVKHNGPGAATLRAARALVEVRGPLFQVSIHGALCSKARAETSGAELVEPTTQLLHRCHDRRRRATERTVVGRGQHPTPGAATGPGALCAVSPGRGHVGALAAHKVWAEESACKPDPVPPDPRGSGGGDHPSRPVVADGLQRSTRRSRTGSPRTTCAASLSSPS